MDSDIARFTAISNYITAKVRKESEALIKQIRQIWRGTK